MALMSTLLGLTVGLKSAEDLINGSYCDVFYVTSNQWDAPIHNVKHCYAHASCTVDDLKKLFLNREKYLRICDRQGKNYLRSYLPATAYDTEAISDFYDFYNFFGRTKERLVGQEVVLPGGKLEVFSDLEDKNLSSDENHSKDDDQSDDNNDSTEEGSNNNPPTDDDEEEEQQPNPNNNAKTRLDNNLPKEQEPKSSHTTSTDNEDTRRHLAPNDLPSNKQAVANPTTPPHHQETSKPLDIDNNLPKKYQLQTNLSQPNNNTETQKPKKPTQPKPSKSHEGLPSQGNNTRTILSIGAAIITLLLFAYLLSKQRLPKKSKPKK